MKTKIWAWNPFPIFCHYVWGKLKFKKRSSKISFKRIYVYPKKERKKETMTNWNKEIPDWGPSSVGKCLFIKRKTCIITRTHVKMRDMVIYTFLIFHYLFYFWNYKYIISLFPFLSPNSPIYFSWLSFKFMPSSSINCCYTTINSLYIYIPKYKLILLLKVTCKPAYP